MEEKGTVWGAAGFEPAPLLASRLDTPTHWLLLFRLPLQTGDKLSTPCAARVRGLISADAGISDIAAKSLVCYKTVDRRFDVYDRLHDPLAVFNIVLQLL